VVLHAELVDIRQQAVVWSHDFPAASADDEQVAQDVAARVRAEVKKRQ
jgi:hypothetical protein